MTDKHVDSLFETVFDIAQVGIFCMDQRGRLVQINPACCEMLGWKREELTGQHFTVIAPDNIAPIADRFLAALMSESKKIAGDWRVRRKDNTLVQVAVKHKTHLNADGTRVAIVTFTDITERVLHDESMRAIANQQEQRVVERTRTLARAEQNFKRVLQGSQDAIYVTQDGVLQYVNPKFVELLGLPSEQLLGQISLQYLHVDDQPLGIEKRNQALSGESTGLYNVRFVRPDGRLVPTEVFSVAVTWGVAPAVLVFVKDVSEHHELQAQLARNIDELGTILSASDTGIALLRAHKYTWVNQRICDIFGYTEDELLGQTTRMLYANDAQYNAVRAVSVAALAKSQDWSGEAEMVGRDGNCIWVHLNGRRASHTNDNSTVWTVVDITERRQIMAALSSSEHKYRQIVERASEAILVGHPERGLLYANARCTELHQLSAVDMRRLSLLDLYPMDSARLAAQIKSREAGRHAAVSEVAEPIALRTRHSTARNEVWHELSCTPIEWQGQSAYLFFANEITERRRMEEDTQRALVREIELSVMKTRFISMASHEFKTPIAIIVSSTELLQHYSNTLTQQERLDAFNDIQVAAKRMNGMLEDMLMLGRADAGRLKLNAEPLDLPEFIDTLQSQVSKIDSNAHPLEVRWIDIDPRQCRALMLDATLLHHMLNNLLINAVKYSPDGCLVLLDIRCDGDCLVFDVTDQGIGIPTAEQPRLFENFFRASNVGQAHGTGLGLAIVKRAAGLHGGSVAVDSVVGHGSVFRLVIPLSQRVDIEIFVDTQI